MKYITLQFHLSRWDIIPEKGGDGWGTYLRLTFLFLTLTLDWDKIPEGLMAKNSGDTL
jgi:hypothetical protein